ncbi:GyrI-like domain-containing protein [Empedobacter brevis]|uniref:GyrI-like domain-containing protein n=1 Tax=Empedobacter brevis TaxID=247 RepID=UPI0028A10856|nr:GyrI-like domain-containing protein [Empedobacter brevis]
MKQVNLFLVILIAILAVLPIVLPDRFDEDIEYEFDAPVGLVYDEFYNLRQFSKWEQFTAADSLTTKKFSNTQEEDEISMTWDSEDAAIASGKITIDNFSVNRFVNYTIKYDGWEKLDSLNVKFDQNENGKTIAKLNYLSQKIPYFYRYFAYFKNPESKFEESLDGLSKRVKIRLDKDKKEGRLNYGEFRIGFLGKTNLLAIKKQTKISDKLIMEKVDASFEIIYKSLMNKDEGGLDFDLGFPYIYFTDFNKEKDQVTFFSGIQLIEDLPLQKGMQKVVVAEGEYLLTLHIGPRSKRNQTIERMNSYAQSKKIKLGTRQLEVMLNDPKETDSLKLMSRIYLPIIK